MVPTNDYLKKHFMTCNPVFNILHQYEPVTTDTVMSETPAIDDGSTMTQFFVDKTLWFVMYMVSVISSNLSTQCLTTFPSVVPWQ